ncbi:MAG: hypothetical protein P4L76_16240, partial [Beijerinckiaceae bacterium]|nr:hypothetical protein [Beijerinckiaceae bacterium]
AFFSTGSPFAVMPGLVPGIHARTFAALCRRRPRCRGVDGRDEPGHDGGVRLEMIVAISRYAMQPNVSAR